MSEAVTVAVSREMAIVIYAYICDCPASASQENILKYFEDMPWMKNLRMKSEE